MEVSRSECRVECDGALKRFQGLPRCAPHLEPTVETQLSELIPCHWIVGVQADSLFQGSECSSELRPVCMIEGVLRRGPQGVRGDQQAVPRGETVIMPSGLEIQRSRVLQVP